MKLSEDVLKVLEGNHLLAYLSTANKEGQPSARLVGAVPSEDLTKIYVGNGRLNKAAKDPSQNKRAMFVVYDSRENVFDIRGFQVECEFVEDIRDKENPIFKAVYDGTEEAVSKEEAELLKSVYIFNVKRIYDCSMDGGGEIVS